VRVPKTFYLAGATNDLRLRREARHTFDFPIQDSRVPVSWFPLDNQLLKFRRNQGGAEYESLSLITVPLTEHLQLRACLHAFGDHLEIEAPRKTDDGGYNALL
jgi:hypothetical protein